jgi:putative Mn2+ efflux pump MntP
MIALLLIAVSASLSNFAGALGIGVSGVDNRTRLRVGLIFGVLEGGMPIAGLFMGRALAGPLGANAHYLGGTLLILTGLYNLAQTYRSQHVKHANHPPEPTDASSPDTQQAPRQLAGRLMITGLALSIDNLAIGFALGTYPVNLLLAAIVIAAVSVGLSLLGLELGRALGNTLGQRAELLGGVVLIVVGIAMIAELL